MATSYKYTKPVQSCIDPNVQRCSPLAKKSKIWVKKKEDFLLKKYI